MCRYTKGCLCEDGDVPMCIPWLERSMDEVPVSMAERHRIEDAEIDSRENKTDIL